MTEIDARTYSAFLQQIELRELWLMACQIENHVGPGFDSVERIEVADRAEWQLWDEGFEAFHSYQLRLGSGTGDDWEVHAVIKMRFGIQYTSEIQMTDELFDRFARANLRLNSWPYAREFVASIVGRMGWLPVTLPAFKAGGPAIGKEPEQPPKKKRRTVRKNDPSDQNPE